MIEQSTLDILFPSNHIKVGHLLSDLCRICCQNWVGISDVEFYVTNSIGLVLELSRSNPSSDSRWPTLI